MTKLSSGQLKYKSCDAFCLHYSFFVIPLSKRGCFNRRGKRLDGTIENSLDLSILHPLDLDDPVLNIKLGVFYLNSLKKNFRDLKLALTAYNWGPTEVRNRLQEDEVLPLAYAMKVLSTYQSYRQDSPHTHKTP